MPIAAIAAKIEIYAVTTNEIIYNIRHFIPSSDIKYVDYQVIDHSRIKDQANSGDVNNEILIQSKVNYARQTILEPDKILVMFGAVDHIMLSHENYDTIFLTTNNVVVTNTVQNIIDLRKYLEKYFSKWFNRIKGLVIIVKNKDGTVHKTRLHVYKYQENCPIYYFLLNNQGYCANVNGAVIGNNNLEWYPKKL
jgi:hypothetical protein